MRDQWSGGDGSGEEETVAYPSRGSRGHFSGMCRPCSRAFAVEGCSAGAACNLCHYRHSDEKIAESELFSNLKQLRKQGLLPEEVLPKKKSKKKRAGRKAKADPASEPSGRDHHHLLLLDPADELLGEGAAKDGTPEEPVKWAPMVGCSYAAPEKGPEPGMTWASASSSSQQIPTPSTQSGTEDMSEAAFSVMDLVEKLHAAYDMQQIQQLLTMAMPDAYED